MTERRPTHAPRRQRGASLVEATVVLPLLLFIVLAAMQAASVFYAKSNLNYASHEAARAGSINNASAASIQIAFQKALLPYYGGGRTAGELAATLAKVVADADSAAVRVEILSPTQESFTDYNSPKLQAAMKSVEPVIPNVGLDELSCPRDVPGCPSDPRSNASGQTLLDANLLKLRITYGIPERKQMPIAGRFYTWAQSVMGSAGTDTFVQALLAANRIPVITHTVVRMQSDAIKNTLMVSAAGPGNAGSPTDPGLPPVKPLPECPIANPTCRGGDAPPPEPPSCP